MLVRFFATLLLALSIIVLAGCNGESSGEPAGVEQAESGKERESPGEESPSRAPLLGSSRGEHAWFSYCEGKEDAASLPRDPRALITKDTNEGKAVFFNTQWEECATKDGPVADRPETCGELRASYARGETLMEGNGAKGASTLFAGSRQQGGLWTLPADRYNRLWQRWGLSSRPEQFDQLVAERYGLSMGDERNPYPLPGENPAETNGGSGQLPIGLTQMRDQSGDFNGEISLTCVACHSNKVGEGQNGLGPGASYSGGNVNIDIELMLSELLGGIAPQLLDVLFVGANKGRGTSQFPTNLGFILTQSIHPEDPNIRFILNAASSGHNTPRPWWQISHKLTKFHNGFLPADNLRSLMLANVPIATPPYIQHDIEGAKEWSIEVERDASNWILGQNAPAYPYEFCSEMSGQKQPEASTRCIDKAKAKQGAILFHQKDLWANGGNGDIPRPKGGNGSCAGCHGAYSPRFSQDSEFLDRPAFKGLAANVTRNEVIETDEAYSNALSNDAFVEYFNDHTFWAYSDKEGCGFNKREGYQTPPLHGVWASAPYFHNGSVPNLWGVLKPSARPAIWERKSQSAPEGLAGDVVMGFDTNLGRAYDFKRIGWQYDTLKCGEYGTGAYIQCNPSDPGSTPLVQKILDNIYSELWFLFNVNTPPITWTREQLERRKIYNTNLYSQGNEGHEFTQVLTDREREAIIEYLKTL